MRGIAELSSLQQQHDEHMNKQISFKIHGSNFSITTSSTRTPEGGSVAPKASRSRHLQASYTHDYDAFLPQVETVPSEPCFHSFAVGPSG